LVLRRRRERERESNWCEIKTFEEYAKYFEAEKTNNKEQVVRSTYKLNELLHKHGIPEKIRSQFVGSVLLALKNGLKDNYKNAVGQFLETSQILDAIKNKINELLGSNDQKNKKIKSINKQVFDDQNVKDLENKHLGEIVQTIENEILPYIMDESTQGQDILNLFFTTFNKYVGKADKNQAFTPDHIVDFMCQVCEVNKNSVVLDPCCGSGAFLVRAMVQAMNDCSNDKDGKEKQRVKENQIYGIEYEEKAFGLVATNMLIHGDGNSNIEMGSCFDKKDWIQKAGFVDEKGSKHSINVVLMNPPYNAVKKCCNPSEVANWKSDIKQDPTKGFHFVHYVASIVNQGKLAVLLPMQCAIGNDKEIKRIKDLMLRNHTLEAVFSLPNEMFYPGASACACCMVFTLGKPHPEDKETFFGYFKDDGFVKKKNLGRIEKVKKDATSQEDTYWKDIEKEWLYLFRNKKEKAGLSVMQKVSSSDEWLAEAYMKTDYSKLTEDDFEQTVRDYIAAMIKNKLPL